MVHKPAACVQVHTPLLPPRQFLKTVLSISTAKELALDKENKFKSFGKTVLIKTIIVTKDQLNLMTVIFNNQS